MTKEENPYADIIHLARPVSKKHPPMAIIKRAAQFTPFWAVKGQKEAIIKITQEHEKQFEE